LDYQSTGGIAIGGSVEIEWFAWKLRQTIYRKDKAKKGILEKITIKRRHYNDGFWESNTRINHPGVAKIQAYVDTFNTVYLQDELVSYVDAVALATSV
jgi:hypothetical protein